jgi:NarL family two-component system response regulator LiaR
MTITALHQTRVTLLGEDELVVRGLASILHDVPRMHLVTVRQWREQPESVDLVLVDVSRYGDVATLQRVVQSVPRGQLVLFCWELSPHLSSLGLRLGARGCLSKTLSAGALVSALRRIANGETVVEGLGAESPAVAHAALTHREAEVLALIASGASNHEIAELLRVSPNTVKSYIRSAYHKIAVDSRSRAVLWAVRNGLFGGGAFETVRRLPRSFATWDEVPSRVRPSRPTAIRA